MDTDRSYFSHPELDRVVGLVMQLAADLHVAQTRCRALEQLLVREGVLPAGAVDAFEPDEAETRALQAARDALLARLLRIMTEDGPSAHPLRAEALAGDRLTAPAGTS
jgi:hypothetical protein